MFQGIRCLALYCRRLYGASPTKSLLVALLFFLNCTSLIFAQSADPSPSASPNPGGVVVNGITATNNGVGALGGSLTFTAGASAPSGITMSYQWQEDGNPIAGATQSSWTTPALQVSDSGHQISFVVTGSDGSSDSSSSITIQVVNGIQLTTNTPSSQTIQVNQPANFSVIATAQPGVQLSYQWFRNGAAIAGANASTYSIAAVAFSNNGDVYTCEVSDAAGSVTSGPMALNVTGLPVSGLSLSVPSSLSVAVGSTLTIGYSITQGSSPLSQNWEMSADGGSSWTAWATTPTISFTAQTSNNGQKFRVNVSNPFGPSATSTPVTLNVVSSPTVNNLPSPIYVNPGQATTLTVTGTGIQNVQWQSRPNSQSAWNPAGTSSSVTTPVMNTTTTTQLQYEAIVSNIAGSAQTNVATLIVTPVPTLASVSNQSVSAGSTATFSLTTDAVAATNPTYQWYQKVNGIFSPIIGANSTSYTTPVADASMNGTQFECVVSNGAGSLTSNIANLSVSTLASPPPSVPPTCDPVSGVTLLISPQTVSPGTTVNLSYTVQQGTAPFTQTYQRSNDSGATWNDVGSALTYAFTAQSTDDVSNGVLFRVNVGNTCGPSATSSASGISVSATLPVIQTQPAPQRVNLGQSAAFSVVASGATSYQWQRNGIAIGGANSASYTTSSTIANDDGALFTVVVSNGAGSVISNPASLTVISPPTISVQPVALITVQSGAVASLSVTAVTATANLGVPLHYQWQKFVNGAWSNVGADSSSYNTPSATGSNNGDQYQVIVSNSAGSVTSTVSTINVITPPTIIQQPQSVSAPVNTLVRFTVVASGTSLNYQWQKLVNGSWTPVAGGTSSELDITLASGMNGDEYEVVVSNSAGSITSNPASVMITAAGVCPTPSAPQFTSPTANQINTGWSVILESTTVGSSQCPVTYEFALGFDSSNCLNNQSLSGVVFNPQVPLFDMLQNLPDINLRPGKAYTACVRAIDSTNPSITSAWGTVSFTTRPETIPTPTNPFTIPSTVTQTSNGPVITYSGQTLIQVGAYNGEEGSTGHFYLRRTNGNDVEVGSIRIGNDPQGKFEIAVDIAPYVTTGQQELQFYAQIERPNANEDSARGQASNTVSYFFDPSLTVPAPKLYATDSTPGHIHWDPVSVASYYRVWRRVGMEHCDPTIILSDGSHPVCFLDNRPFQMIAQIQSGTLTYDDTSNASKPLPQTLPAAGVSYFVTAHDAQGFSSLRSNSVSFHDSVSPSRAGGETVNFLPLATATDAIGFICNLGEAQYFDGDNSPDLEADIAYVETNHPCNDPTIFNNVSTTTTPVFDTLTTTSGTQYNQFNCIAFTQLHNLTPNNTAYCIRTCLRDISGNSEADHNGLCTVNAQSTPANPANPVFLGLDSVTPLDSGTGLQPNWTRPVEAANSTHVIQYLVQYTSEFHADGTPEFSADSDIETIDANQSNAVIEGLDTNTNYCFQLSYEDNLAHRVTPPNRVICAKTLNNNPIVTGLDVMASDTEDQYRLRLEFKVVSREAGLPNFRVSLDSLQYQIAGGDWVDIQTRDLGGLNLNTLRASSSTGSAPANIVYFDTLPYFAGQQDFQFRVRVKDNQGYVSEYTVSGDRRVFDGMSKIGSFDDTQVSGCELNLNSTATHSIWIGLCCALGAYFLLRRRNPDIS